MRMYVATCVTQKEVHVEYSGIYCIIQRCFCGVIFEDINIEIIQCKCSLILRLDMLNRNVVHAKS